MCQWLASDYSGKYFVKRLAGYNRNTRRCNDFVRAFHFCSPQEWNGLPDNIKNTKEIDIFKQTLFNNVLYKVILDML